jgi:hypothetical protein
VHVPACSSLCTSQDHINEKPKQCYPTAPVAFSFKDMYHLFRTMSVVVIIMRMGMKDGV